MAVNPSERIIGLAAFLEGRKHSGTTLGDIVGEVPGYSVDGDLEIGSVAWETVRKRLQRDLEMLERSFGIVVDYDEQQHAYRLRAPYFTPDERRALIAAAAAVDVEGIGDTPVLGELGAAVDDDGQRIVLAVPERVRDLSAAIRARRSVRFLYHGRERTVDAYVIGRWRTHWYVAGYEHEAGQRRRYRLDRIEHPTIGLTSGAITPFGADHSYEIPSDIDAVAEMRLDPNDWGHDPPVVARLRVDADLAHNVQHELGGRVVARATDTCEIELDVRHYQSFCDRVLAFGTHVRLLAPAELVTRLCDHLRAAAQSDGV